MQAARGFFVHFIVSVMVLAGLTRPFAAAAEPRLATRHGVDFLQFFDTLALTADYGPFNSRPAWVRKWAGPVKIVPVGAAERLRPELDVLAKRVSQWTGLRFFVAGPDGNPRVGAGNTITIRLVSRDDAGRPFPADDIVCQTETHGIGGELHTGFIVLSEAYIDCLRHEFMHVLGFDSHWRPNYKTAIRSVLSYRQSETRTADFSPWDIEAIRLLYNSRIRAGMSRQRSLVIVNEVLAAPAAPASSSAEALRPVGGPARR